MTYTQQQFEQELEDETFPHLKSRKRFKNFYNQLGKQCQQAGQGHCPERMNFIVPKGNIMELGCHSGFNLAYYATIGFFIDGIDVSPSLIKLAQERIETIEDLAVRRRIGLYEGFIEDFEPDIKYDTIIVTETLEHCINPSAIMQKAKEILAKDGTIYVSTPQILIGNSSHVRGINNNEMRELAKEVGGLTCEIISKDNQTFMFAALKKLD